MLELREEELNMVNGGVGISEIANAVGLATGLIRPKFKDGDRVISKSSPDLGVGTVVDEEYHEGWFYYVITDGGRLYTSEDDLEFALL